MNVTSYEAAGVNVGLGERFVERIKSLTQQMQTDKLRKAAGGYAAVYALTQDRYVALTTDGVGTKVLLAHQLGKHQGIGIDLVAMCANDLICVGAQPSLFLDYYATGKLDLEMGTQLIEGIIEGCHQAGMILVGGETAEMPDVYKSSQYDLAGFALGELSPQQLLTGERILPGQKVIGLASSGIHSNGLSLARKVFTAENDLLTLLEPTRIYVKPIVSALQDYPGAITGICHVTGGGWRNLFRLNTSVGFEINNPLPVLPVFQKMIAQGIPEAECYKTFNMGLGLAVIAKDSAERLVEQFNRQGFQAQIIGEVTDDSERLVLSQQSVVLENEIRKGRDV